MPFELINLLTALIILFIGVGAATLTSKIVKKVIHELEIDRVLREQAGGRIPAKEFVPNVVAGFMIYRKNRFKEGDYIKVKDIEGKVVHVNLVETRIKTKGKDIVYIPNSMLSREIIRIKN